MKPLQNLLNPHLTGKKVLLLFILTNLVYALMLLLTIPGTMAYANGLKLLDMLPQGYDAAYIQTLLSTLGEEGRNFYLYRQIPLDMVYPGLFAISYCLVMGYFLKKLHLLHTTWFALCLLPIVAGVADYLENIGIIHLLLNYPYLSAFTMSFTNVFSIVKSMTTTLFFVALIITLMAWVIKRIKQSLSKTTPT